MTGFSMGCYSALRLAAETPDQWAGLNLASGLWPGSEDMLDNLPGLPIALWAGELDQLSQGMRAFAEQCQAKGVTHRLTIAPNLPHTYPYAEYKANVAYLMQFKRPARPDEFSYAAIKGATAPAGAYGITLRPARRLGPAPAGPPQMTCRVSGDTVRIESENTAGLHVVLGTGGLGLSGDVKVLWNGRPAYEGEAKAIDLTE